MTPNELDVLHLGKMVEAEQRRDGTGGDAGLRSRKADLREKHRQARREQFDDLGFQ